MMENLNVPVSRCLSGGSLGRQCAADLPWDVGDHSHKHPKEGTKVGGTCTAASGKSESFPSTGRGGALLQSVIRERRFSGDVRSLFVTKQAVFLLCVCAHNAYLSELGQTRLSKT